MHRREFLALGTATVGLLAGCADTDTSTDVATVTKSTGTTVQSTDTTTASDSLRSPPEPAGSSVLAGWKGTLSAGGTELLPFLVTNTTDERWRPEIGANGFFGSVGFEFDAEVPNGEWRTFEVLTRWTAAEPLSPSESVVGYLPLKIGTDAQGRYTIRVTTRNGPADSADIQLQVPPVPDGPELDFYAFSGILSASNRVIPSDRCLDIDRTAVQYWVRNAGSADVVDVVLDIEYPEGWEVVETVPANWTADRSGISLGTLAPGHVTTVVIEFSVPKDADPGGEALTQTLRSKTDSETVDLTFPTCE